MRSSDRRTAGDMYGYKDRQARQRAVTSMFHQRPRLAVTYRDATASLSIEAIQILYEIVSEAMPSAFDMCGVRYKWLVLPEGLRWRGMDEAAGYTSLSAQARYRIN